MTLLLALLACRSENEIIEVDDNYGGKLLTITGRVCDYDRNTWLEGAIVYTHLYDRNNVVYGTSQATSDASGTFVLEDIPGEGVYSVYVQYGSEMLDMYDVKVGADGAVLPEPNCGVGESSVAVISGSYDDLDEIMPALGFGNYVEIKGTSGDELAEFLSNPANLEVYDILFFNGGHLEEDVFYDMDGDSTEQVAAVLSSIKAYTEAGGTVFATDWSYDVIERAWPGAVEFLGDDNLPDDAQRGEEGLVSAKISDDKMKKAVGGGTMDVSYDLIEWPPIEGVGEKTSAPVRGTVQYSDGMDTRTMESRPMLVHFDVGEGKVVYSTWRIASNAEGGPIAAVKSLLEPPKK